MSRIGKIPVLVPQGINVEINAGEIKVKGPKGELKTPFKPEIVDIKQADGKVTVSLKMPEEKAYFGLIRKLIFNMVHGQQIGYEKKLEISGVGYKASVQGKKMTLMLGFSHPVEITIPDSISVEILDSTKVTMKSSDREALGDFAARIRGLRKAEPYKGKGIKYSTETIRRKVGKTGV
jgi:large subunit ribosomal protein L6